MRVAAIAIVTLLTLSSARAQEPSVPDSTTYISPDSIRIFDSTYRARKAMLDRWIKEQHHESHAQQDFISLYFSYGAYLQILARDLNQFFAERSQREDPSSDRNNYSTLDHAFFLGGQAQLSRSWGIYTEYSLLIKYFNTQIDTDRVGAGLKGFVEELNMTEHAFVVGGMYIIYSSPFYRLRANGGIGAVLAVVSESEVAPNGSVQTGRSSSAAGFQVNFDLLNDFRVMEKLSFTLDLLTRSVSTGALKTSAGKSIEEQSGRNPYPATLAPTATNMVYGFAAGLVYYF